MGETVVKAIDFLGYKDRYIQVIGRIFGRNPVRKLSDRLFCVIELGYYKKELFEVQWAHVVHWDDLVLPRQAAQNHNLMNSLEYCPGEKQGPLARRMDVFQFTEHWMFAQ